MDKVVVFFVEGDTEEAFYKKLTQCFREFCENKKFAVRHVKIKNLKGISNFRTKIARVIERDCLNKFENSKIFPVLCYDMDVFEYGRNPPVDWKTVEKDLRKLPCVGDVIHLKARQTIEDWFLIDEEGVREFLGIPARKKPMTRYGYKEICALFKQANKTYVKGRGAEGLINKLDMEKIIQKKQILFDPVIQLLSIP
ncbi:hypothetical protein [Selenomonas noxia]|uniref:hypothetical protein n=1 Tax=Selenomonas noxia TaxID=135083 RepID=UPI0028E91C39|nr:hypothetical protein [Selenomonas noxia]